jgi:hypothetical protein
MHHQKVPLHYLTINMFQGNYFLYKYCTYCEQEGVMGRTSALELWLLHVQYEGRYWEEYFILIL